MTCCIAKEFAFLVLLSQEINSLPEGFIALSTGSDHVGWLHARVSSASQVCVQTKRVTGL